MDLNTLIEKMNKINRGPFFVKGPPLNEVGISSRLNPMDALDLASYFYEISPKFNGKEYERILERVIELHDYYLTNRNKER